MQRNRSIEARGWAGGRLHSALWLAAAVACGLAAWAAPARAQAPDPAGIWEMSRGTLRANLTGALNAGNPQLLYDTQLLTHPLLLWLGRQPDTAQSRQILDEVCELYSVAFAPGYLNQAVEPQSKVTYYGWLSLEGGPGAAYYGQERFLDSVQFLAGATEAIRLAARIPADERSVNMQQLMVQVPTIVQAYLRWMTGDMRVNTQFDPLNPATPVFDVSLNLAEGCLNLMAAVDSGGLKYDLPAGLYDYSIRTIWPRLAPTGDYSRVRWFAPNGAPATSSTPAARAVFDPSYVPGSLSSNRCGFYEYLAPPGQANECPARRAGAGADGMTYDLGHSWRLVYLLDSYQHCGDPTIMRQATVVVIGLTWQFVSQVWNQDINNPLFANYFGDSNGDRLDGWVDVKFGADGARDPSHLDYGPSVAGTDVAPLFFAWAEYDPTLKQIADVFYTKNFSQFYDPAHNWSRALKYTPLLPRYYIEAPRQ